jgi:tetratricopeptide (TPR) repeat protein
MGKIKNEIKNSKRSDVYLYGYRLSVILIICMGIFFLNCNTSPMKKPSPGKLDKDALADYPESNSTIDLKPLLTAISKTGNAELLEIEQLLDPYKEMKKTSPMWPIYAFLVGELHRERKDSSKAREIYQNLAEWASTEPYGDTWGGSGLACLALWRWLRLIEMDTEPERPVTMRMIEAAEKLMETRLVRGMFFSSILCGLPQLEEDILRRLALISWSIGCKNRAQRLFLNYLMVASTAELRPLEKKLINLVLSSGLASPDRLALLRGKRLYLLKRYNDAFELLTKARENMNPQVKAEADFYLANLKRIKGVPRAEIIELLSTVIKNVGDPNIAQKSLFLRAMLYNREGRGKNVKRFLKDLVKLIEDFPKGNLADDALYEIARHYQVNGNEEQALNYFKQLRNFKGKNDWINLASFHPAILLYTRGKPGDLEKAAELLIKLDKQNPFGPLHLASLFWLGRIAAETGDKESSESYFQRIIKESPYDYYAIRARMHLHINQQARKQLMPDPETVKELHSAYLKSKVDPLIAGESPYHIRLNNAINTGLYSRALAADREIRKFFPSKRLEKLSLKELDNSNLLPHISLLLSLRQDALAAKDKLSQAKNRLQIAGVVGYAAGDWPLSINMIMAYSEPYEKRWAAQKNINYLATAYPSKIFRESITKISAARNVRPELLYSIIRRESCFYPAALSTRAALGLFQFIPSTFENLDKQWQLTTTSGIQSRYEFLLDPELNIDLGARWVKDKLIKRHKGNILLALIEHNAGYSAVREWIKMWKELGRSNDIEYMVETIRFSQTRIFMRGVLTDMAIVNSAGIFKTEMMKGRFGSDEK